MKKVPLEVIKWINQERKKMGRPPINRMLRGTRYIDSRRCPIATSLGRNGVIVDPIGYFKPNKELIRFPRFVLEFSNQLARNEYPQLIGAKK